MRYCTPNTKGCQAPALIIIPTACSRALSAISNRLFPKQAQSSGQVPDIKIISLVFDIWLLIGHQHSQDALLGVQPILGLIKYDRL
jgi:hypothetical protein